MVFKGAFVARHTLPLTNVILYWHFYKNKFKVDRQYFFIECILLTLVYTLIINKKNASVCQKACKKEECKKNELLKKQQ